MINPKLYFQGPKKDAVRLLAKTKSELSEIDAELLRKEFPILMLFSVNGKRLQYYTQINMPLKHYVDKGKYPFSNKWIDAPGAKLKLDTLKSHALAIENDLVASKAKQSVDVYRAELDKRFKGKREDIKEVPTLADRLAEYLEFVKNTHSYNTFRCNQSNVNHIREFVGKELDTKLVEDIDRLFLQRYADHLKAGRLNNTVVKSMQVFRTFLQYCVNEEYIKELPKMKIGSPNDITVIHLTYDEVQKIAYTPMPSLRLERVRDFFILGCNIGARYGDIAKLKKENCKVDGIRFLNEKNKNTKPLVVPYTSMSKNIIEKYKNSPGEYAIPSCSNQKMNDFLKEVGEIAGIDENIEIAHKNGKGEITPMTVKKFKLLSCHTSRKSFITIALTLGMTESTIISITGHSKGSKAFHKYYEVVDDVKKKEMALFNR